MLEEKDYFAALGLGEQEQEPAEPVETVSDTTETEPAEQEQAEEEPEEEEADPVEDEKPEKPAMSIEERRRHAAERRRKELEEAVAKARLEEQQKFKEKEKSFFERAKLKNQYDDDKLLTSFDDFERWYQAQQSNQLEQNLKDGRLTPEDLQAVFERLPVVQQAKQIVEQQQQQKPSQEFENKVQEELSQIHKMDPSVSTLNDILKMDTAGDFRRYVQEKGLSYLEAFKLANADKIAQRRAEREKARIVTAVASKSHLSPTGGTVDTMLTVPPEVAEMYRAMDPGMSSQEMQKEYNKWFKPH